MLKAIVFDFDGVILESVDIKTRAFVELFNNFPQHKEKIVKLHLENGGMSRYRKFEIIYREFLRRPLDEDERKNLGDSFSQIVYREILACPYVPGAREFVDNRKDKYQLYVASGTPQSEIWDIVQKRNLNDIFIGVYGSPSTKAEILRKIMSENGWQPREIIFIGDAMTDYQGALQAGVPFIGRVPSGERNSFPKKNTITIIRDLRMLNNKWQEIATAFSES